MRFAWARDAASKSYAFDRETVDPDLLREYDTFGPWVGEVLSARDMPRRFRDHHPANAGARYLLKVPMELDRRTILPGQDLYRAILAVHDEHVLRLVLEDGRVTETWVNVRDIVAITNHTCLLRGIVCLHLSDGSELSLPYNTTSQRLMNGVIDFLRRRSSPEPVARLDGAPSAAVTDYYFRNLVANQRGRSGPCAIVYCEEPGQVFVDARGRRRRAHGLLAFDSGSELTVMVTGRAVGSKRDLTYALDRAYVPHDAVQGHELCEVRGRWRTRRFLRLRISGHALDFPISGEGSPLRALLERLSAGQAHRAQPIRKAAS
jgi:hypothetical protein